MMRNKRWIFVDANPRVYVIQIAVVDNVTKLRPKWKNSSFGPEGLPNPKEVSISDFPSEFFPSFLRKHPAIDPLWPTI